MEHKKLTKPVIAGVSVLLALLFAFAVVLTCIVINTKKSTFTVYSDDEYYSETTYFFNEKEYNKYLQAKATEQNDGKSTAKKATSAEKSDEKFVQGVAKKVWVAEAADDNGNTVSSRLLKKVEVNKFEQRIQGALSTNATVVMPDPPPTAPTVPVPPPDEIISIGTDSESFYYLSINLKVTFNETKNYFTVTGDAGWEAKLVGAWDRYKAAEEDYDDFLGITWGGAGTYLRAKNGSINASGKYHNDKEVSVSRKETDPYAGFVLQFREKSGWMGKEMKNLTTSFELEKVYAEQGLETCAKLTYIHTYNHVDTSGSLTISVGTETYIAATINWEDKEKSWQTEIAIAGLTF